jgi:hypothetical protein
MTFEQFQATRKHIADLATLPDDLSYSCMAETAGYLYRDSLVIEDTATWPPRGEDDRPVKRWYVLIGNAEHNSDDLEDVERKLYEFAVSEGYGA